MTLMQKYDIDFPRAHGELICSGRIKVHAQDFEVIEDLGFEPSGSGEHLYVKVRKTDANTAWVARQLADFAGIRRNDVGYAGRKDRRAIATQWFSCWLPGRQDPDWRSFCAEGVEILATARHERKLKRGNLSGNAFRILIRGLTQQAQLAQKLARRLETIGQCGVPNYFGRQRFGKDCGNLHKADALLGGRIRVRDRQQRGLYLSAARSYLFNLILSARVKDDTWRQKTADGRDPSGPLYGSGHEGLPEETALLAGMQSWCEGLQRLGLKQSRRALLMRIVDLHGEFHSPDQLELTCTLDKGCYATSVLREIVCWEEFD
tara:strand:+ start:4948 stop:5904 length:957 start_codon:yes stop_codon:yes gene_type:complete